MELRDYVKVIRARWWLFVLSIVAVLAVFLVMTVLQKPSYQGQAEVIVLEQQNTGSTLLLGAAQDQQPVAPDQADVLTQAQVIQSPLIAERVIRDLRLNTTAASLLLRVTATTDGQSNIVTIDALDGSASGAADIANAFARAYVAWSRDAQVSSLKTAADEVQQSLDQAQQQITALTHPAGGVTATTQSQLQLAETLYASLASKLEQLRINQQIATGSASILATAVADPKPVSPNPLRNAGLGLALGVALGLGAVFLAEQMDTKIRSAQEAEEIYGAPVLGSIPLDTFAKNETQRLTVLQHPDSPAADAYRGLRINLDFVNFESHIKTVLVTSAAPSEGKSTVAANLATALSQAGQSVVLLNCDFHRPPITTFFECANGKIGLSDLLRTGQPEIEAFQKPAGLEHLAVVAPGTTPPNPSDLLGSSSMRDLVASLRESMDWIIVDAPPVLAVADTIALARWMDGVLIVTHIGASTHGAARAARDQLDKIGARIIGISAWGLQNRPARAYSGYYKPY